MKLAFSYSFHQLWFYWTSNFVYQQRSAEVIGVEYVGEIVNNFARIKVIQKFRNTADNYLSSAEYNLPIDTDVCMESFIAKYAGVIIKGVVRSKQDARSDYIQSKQEGNMVSYAETQEKDLEKFVQVKLDNIPPGENVEIQLTFSQQLPSILNKYFCLSIPIDLQTIRPSVMVCLSCTNRITYTEVRGHEVQKQIIDENQMVIQLDDTIVRNKRGTLFQLLFAYEGMFDLQVIFGISNPYEQDKVKANIIVPRASANISFLPDFNKDVSDEIAQQLQQSKEIFETKQCDELIDHMGSSMTEYIFLLDRSGSMRGHPLQTAIKALTLFLQSLPNNSYFNIISFGSRVDCLNKISIKYSKQNLQLTINRINRFEANLGGTNIYLPLQIIFQGKRIPGYNRQIFLLTDGAVQSPQQVIHLIQNNSKFNRVHSVGFGNSVDQYLIEESARAGKGIHEFTRPGSDLSNLILDMLARSISPTIDQFEIQFSDNSIIDTVYPEINNLPCVFKEEIFNFNIFFKPLVDVSSLTDSQKTLQVSYYDSKLKQRVQKQVKLNPIDSLEFNIELKNSMFRLGKQMQINDKLTALRQYPNDPRISGLENEAVDYQLLTDRTALICTIAALSDEMKAKYDWSIRQNPSFTNSRQVFLPVRISQDSIYQQIGMISSFQQVEREMVRSSAAQIKGTQNIQTKSSSLSSNSFVKGDTVRPRTAVCQQQSINLSSSLQINPNIIGANRASQQFSARPISAAVCKKPGQKTASISQKNQSKKKETFQEEEKMVKCQQPQMSKIQTEKISHIIHADRENEKDRDQNIPETKYQDSKYGPIEQWLSIVDFQGVWTFDIPRFSRFIALSQKDLNFLLERLSNNNDALMTLAVLCLLECQYAEHKQKWQLIVKKSQAWLKQLVQGINLQELKEHLTSTIIACL